MKSFFKVLLVLCLITQLSAVNQDFFNSSCEALLNVDPQETEISCPLHTFSPNESKVFGHDLIHAKVGDDVILPCQLCPPFNVNNLTIEWKFQGQIIHLHRSRDKDNKTPDPKYKNRTCMFHDKFKKGNISLRLTNVTKEDEGNYTCFVPKLESQVRKGKVILKLDENGAQGNSTDTRGGNGDNNNGPAGVIVGIVVGAVILILIIIITYYVVRRHRGQPIFPCWNNNSQNEQVRNDGDRRGNGNQGDEAEEIPLQNQEQPN